ncbi:MAG: type II secretion system protein GspD, partial [Pseudomonas sp.]|nr:type II secretion system protein GspD [Pseudomonas sp.]
MKWSLPNAAPYRKVAPLLLLALGACSNPQSSAPLLVDSELGQPLADTRRSGDTPLDRQRETVPPPRVQHPVTNSARSHGAAPARARNPLGDQPVQLNFVDADIQAVVRALSRATGQQFLVDPRVKGNLTLVSEGQVPAHQAYDMLLAALRMQGFSVVDVGGVAQVVPEADAKLLGGPIYSGANP